MISSLSLEPYVGSVNLPVQVSWVIGDEINWLPTLDDELHLVTSAGAVIGRASIYEAYRKSITSEKAPNLRTGSATLVCPPFTGGFVLTMMDCASNRRMISQPFRVAGPPMNPKVGIQLTKHSRMKPFGRVDCRLDVLDIVDREADPKDPMSGSLKDFVLVVCKPDMPDNRGINVAPYSLGSRVIKLPAFPNSEGIDPDAVHNVSFIAPEEEGEYEIRCMATPKCGIPYTYMKSGTFEVTHEVRLTYEEERDQNSILGSLKANTTKTNVGSTISVRFDVTSPCGHILSPLDSIVMYPYGRTESIKHIGGSLNCISETLYAGTMDILAPAAEGFYDVGYFSFNEQRVVLTAESISVVQPLAELKFIRSSESRGDTGRRHLRGDSAGSAEVHQIDGPLTVEYAVDESLFSPLDRIIVTDDMTNVVASAHVEKPKHRRDGPNGPSSVLAGQCKTTLYLQGKYMVRYYSIKAEQCVCRMPGFISVVPLRSQSFPTANLFVVRELTDTSELSIGFSKEGNDTRSAAEQAQDCIAVFEHGAADRVVGHQRDDIGSTPALATHYLRGAHDSEVTFPCVANLLRDAWRSLDGSMLPEAAQNEAYAPIRAPRKFSVRYMIGIHRHFMRICISECIITVFPESMLPAYRALPLASLSLQDCSEVRHRFVYETPSSGTRSRGNSINDGEDSIADRSSSAAPRSYNSSRRQSLTSIGSSVYGSRRKSAASAAKAFTSILHLRVNETSFQGAVMQPRVVSTTDQVVVTYHITAGLPREADKIVLFTDDCTVLVSEVPLSLAVGRSDLSLGTVILNPPKVEGKYICGYFSDKYQSIVLASEPFRVSQGVGPFSYQNVDKSITSLIPSEDALNASSAVPKMHNSMGASTSMSAVHERPNLAPSSAIHSNNRKPRTRVLIVSVGYMKQYFERTGALNDAERFTEAVKEAFFPDAIFDNFEEWQDAIRENILVLHEMQSQPTLHPTANNIRTALRWLVNGAYPKDHLVFYFSGCGSTDSTGDRLLLPTDYDWGSRCISYREIGESYFNTIQPGVGATMLVDACFSSNILDIVGQRGIWRETALTRADEIPLGVRIQRQRWERRGIQPRTTWRSMFPPAGLQPNREYALHDVGHSDPANHSQAFGGMLFQPYQSQLTPNQANGSGKQLVVYEAARGQSYASQGSIDSFMADFGCTMGLFTYALTKALSDGVKLEVEMPEEADTASVPVLRWWELHERVRRVIASTPYIDQLPRLLVGDIASLDEPVTLVVAEAMAAMENEF